MFLFWFENGKTGEISNTHILKYSMVYANLSYSVYF
jgi:hypothetical protein